MVIHPREGGEYIGYSPSNKSVGRIQQKVGVLLERRNGAPWEEVCQKLNYRISHNTVTVSRNIVTHDVSCPILKTCAHPFLHGGIFSDWSIDANKQPVCSRRAR